MRFVSAYDPATGELAERQDARDKDESTRYSHEYRCLEKACGCRFHWRRAVRAKENTEFRPATFVKNKSSEHRVGCHYDYSAFAEQHRDVAFLEHDYINLRIQFPLGGARSDLYPWEKGMLTQKQIAAARNNIDKRGFKTLRELVDFIEDHRSGLEDPSMADVNLYYQGLKLAWNDLWVASDNYKKLLLKAQEKDESEKSAPTLTVVKPDHEIEPNAKGKRRIVCRPQYAKPNYKTLQVKPILVCSDDYMVAALNRVAEKEGSLLVASRPFMVDQRRTSDVLIYLSVPEISQLSQVKSDYWRRVSGPRHQLSLPLDEQVPELV